MTVLIAGSKVLPPFVETCFTKLPDHCANPGVDIIVLMRILRHAGLAIQLKEYYTWDDMETALQLGEIDILASTEIYPEPSISQFAFPLPTNMDRPVFFVKRPPTIANFQEVIQSILNNYGIWICLFCSFAIGYLFRKFAVEKILKHNDYRPNKIQIHSWIDDNRLATGTVLVMLSFLALTVVLGVYGNTIAIMLAQVIPPTNTFETAEQLAHLITTGVCKMIYYDYMYSEYVNQTGLRDVFDAGGYTLEDSQPDGIDEYIATRLVNSTTCLVFLDYKTKIPYYKLINEQIDAIEDTSLAEKQYAYYVRNSMPSALKESLIRAYYGGTSEVIYVKELDNVVIRRKSSFSVWGNSDITPVHPLTLLQLGDMFMYLIVALTICIAILAIEKLVSLGLRRFANSLKVRSDGTPKRSSSCPDCSYDERFDKLGYNNSFRSYTGLYSRRFR